MNHVFLSSSTDNKTEQDHPQTSFAPNKTDNFL